MIRSVLNHLKIVFVYEEVCEKEEELSKSGRLSGKTLALII